MPGWFSLKWIAFLRSYRNEDVQLCGPSSVFSAFSIFLFGIFLITFIEPIASSAQFRHSWLPLASVSIGVILSMLFWKMKGKGHIAGLLTLFDSFFWILSISLTVCLTSPPISHGIAFVFGVIITSSYARLYSLTLLFVVMLLGAALIPAFVFGNQLADIIVIILSCLIAIWISYQTGQQREIQEQNKGLKQALSASEQVVNESMDIAFSATALKIGHFIHELRNAQMVIEGSLSMFQEFENKDEIKNNHHIQCALEGSKRMKKLVDEAINSLRYNETISQRKFLVDKEIQGTCESLSYGPRIQITEMCKDFWLKGNRDHFCLILKNIIRNAEQAGATSVQLSCMITRNQSAIILSISDNGPGFPPEILENLFQPFATFGKKTGTGLGLYLIKRFVQLFGGDIEAKNAVSGGAIVQLHLPGQVIEYTESTEEILKNNLSLEHRMI